MATLLENIRATSVQKLLIKSRTKTIRPGALIQVQKNIAYLNSLMWKGVVIKFQIITIINYRMLNINILFASLEIILQSILWLNGTYLYHIYIIWNSRCVGRFKCNDADHFLTRWCKCMKEFCVEITILIPVCFCTLSPIFSCMDQQFIHLSS